MFEIKPERMLLLKSGRLNLNDMPTNLVWSCIVINYFNITMKSKALSFCFLGLTTVEAAINVLVSGYYGGSAQRTMIKVAETLA